MNNHFKHDKGIVFNIQRYCIHDGPGIRTVVFLKGCQLNCRWCANPESQNVESELFINKARCINCYRCIDVCPQDCISILDGNIYLNKKDCIKCNKCVNVCKPKAITSIGHEMTVDSIHSKIIEDKIFYDVSDGGVTFSGGEPFVQAEFLTKMLIKCKESGINTLVETCGYVDSRLIMDAIDYIDTFYIDLKIMDNEKHLKYTGVSNYKILSNIEFLSNRKKDILIRIPIIPGVNDDEVNINNTGYFLTKIGIAKVQLLPYHNYGVVKYSSLGREYNFNSKIPTSTEMDQIKSLLSNYGLDVTI